MEKKQTTSKSSEWTVEDSIRVNELGHAALEHLKVILKHELRNDDLCTKYDSNGYGLVIFPKSGSTFFSSGIIRYAETLGLSCYITTDSRYVGDRLEHYPAIRIYCTHIDVNESDK